jgi:hypothetical protein
LFPILSLVAWTLVGTVIVAPQLSMYPASGFVLWSLVTISLATSAGTAYIVYAIIDRRNKHFGRDKALLSSIVQSLLSNSRRDDMKTLIAANSAERELSTIIREDHERSGILWGLLAMVPYVGSLFTIIVSQLVSGDYRKHETTENIVLGDIDNAIRSAGFRPISMAQIVQTMADVSGLVLVGSVMLLFAVASSFLLVSIAGLGAVLVAVPLSLGALSVVTIYSAIESPLGHFNTHQIVDSELVQSITS